MWCGHREQVPQAGCSAAGGRRRFPRVPSDPGADPQGKVASRMNMTDHPSGPALPSLSLAPDASPEERLPQVSRRSLLGGGVLLALAALVPEPALALRIPRGFLMVPGMLRIPAPSRRGSGSSGSGRSGSGSASRKSGSGSRKNRKDQEPPGDTAARGPDTGARDPKAPVARTTEPPPSGGASASSGSSGPGAGPGPAVSGGGASSSAPPASGPASSGAPLVAGTGAAATGGRQVITDGDY